ncbi:FtsX-like permease family protein [Granulicoccus sp. GXG6511]|uniref:FtsX-like permease family protein n=1 Tax=Granulicoccus sp. GXG6511 TaxID=3381351 RepID=UPI003D7CE576
MLVAILVAMVAALVAAVGALTVRLAIRTAVAADLSQIGAMKAVGLPVTWIRRAYLTKYLLLAVLGAALGAGLAPVLQGPLTRGALLEIGSPTSNAATVVAWIGAAVVVAAGSVAFCWWLLRPVSRIPALAAMRATTATRRPWLWRWRLSRSRLPATTWLGLRSASTPGQIGLVLVFALLALMCFLPAQVATTMRAPGFVTYLGIGRSDALIETRDAGTARTLDSRLASDPAIARRAAFTQIRGQVKTPDGWEQVPVDLGDHAAFPLQYADGGAPTSRDEVAVSYRVASEREVGVGDQVMFRDALGERPLRVSGVYQDITNGGRTAKGVWQVPDEQVVGWTHAILLAPNVDRAATVARWHEQFPGAVILGVDDVSRQTMGSVLDNLDLLVRAAIVLAGVVTLGLTALFLHLVLATGAGEWAVLRGIGVSDGRLRRTFNVRYLALLACGLLAGAIIAALTGRFLVAPAAGAFLGAPGLQLQGMPWLAALSLPLVLASAVVTGSALGSTHLQHLSVRSVTEE